MNRRRFAASALSTAIGLAMAMQAQPTAAQGMQNPPRQGDDRCNRGDKQDRDGHWVCEPASSSDRVGKADPRSGHGRQRQTLGKLTGRRGSDDDEADGNRCRRCNGSNQVQHSRLVTCIYTDRPASTRKA
jgi:hypothetical protein